MKKRLFRVISLFLCTILIAAAIPAAGAVLFNAPIDPFPVLPGDQCRPVTPPQSPSGTSSRPAERFTPSIEAEPEPEFEEEASAGAPAEAAGSREQPSGAAEPPSGTEQGAEKQEEPVELSPLQIKIFSPHNSYGMDESVYAIDAAYQSFTPYLNRQIITDIYFSEADLEKLASITVDNTKFLIIICPTRSLLEYAPTLEAYLQRGGCIWLCGENEMNFARENEFIRELTKKLGITFSLGKDSTYTYTDLAKLNPDSFLGKKNHFGSYQSVGLYAANSIMYEAPAEPVITLGEKTYMIDAPVGSGFLTVSADINLISSSFKTSPWAPQILYNMLDRSYTEILVTTLPHTPPKGQTLPYTGEAQTLVVPGQVDADKGTLSYSLDGAAWDPVPPKGTEVGVYNVYWKIDAKPGYISVGPEMAISRIEPLAGSHIPPTVRDLTYNGSAQTLVNRGSVNADMGTLYYSLNGTVWSETLPEGTDAGTYPVYWKIDAKPGYTGVGPERLNAEIKPAALACTPPAGRSLSYTGTAQPLCDAGSVTGGTLEYSRDNAAWSAAPPTETEPGSYEIFWRAVPDANHTGPQGGSVRSTIAERPQPKPEPQPEPTPDPKPSSRPASTPRDTDRDPRYPVEVQDAAPLGGAVRTNLRSASERDTVYIDAVPAAGYDLLELTAVDKSGNSLPIQDLGKNRYSFKMPASKATVSAAFQREKPRWNSGFTLCSQGSLCPIARFSDAQSAAWYHDGLHFCLENGLMSGVNDRTLRPNAPISRAAFLTILWRLDGSPVVNGLLPFGDVPQDLWCAEAVRWAVSEQLASGYRDGRFRPAASLSREQMAAILFRYAQHKGLANAEENQGSLSGFADAGSVNAYAVPAFTWACQSGLIGGQTAGGRRVLNPQGTSSRAQAAAVIARYVKTLAE